LQLQPKKCTLNIHVGEYNKHKAEGVYNCAACDAPLYKSETKFDSGMLQNSANTAHVLYSEGCGWPAFFEALPDALETVEDNSHGMQRIEIMCKNCGGHLGHVFRV
jgi:peptide-methionine (R)-S-oxide reductase